MKQVDDTPVTLVLLLWLYPRLLVTIKPDSQMHLGELGEGSSSKNALKEAEITKENHHFTSINSMQQQQLLYKAELSGNEEKKVRCSRPPPFFHTANCV